MEEIGTFNNRKLLYQKYALDSDWSENIPVKDWLLLIISDNLSTEEVANIACKVIDNDVCYACCVGKQKELLHDAIDWEFVLREIGEKTAHLPPYDVIMTSSHKDLDDGFWFAFFVHIMNLMK